MFSKYSNEDINSLTADEILNYINLYGSYTEKDLVNKDDKVFNNDKHKNWGDDKKLKVDNFEFANDIVTKFKEFFTECFIQYLNGNLSIEQILNSILSGDYSSIKNSIDTVIDNSDDKNYQYNKDNMNEFEDNPQHDRDNEFSGNNPNKDKLQENNSTDKMPGYDESNKNNFDRNDNYSEDSNKNTNENNNKLPSNTSTSSNTGDTSNLLLALSGIIGLLGIKKRR